MPSIGQNWAGPTPLTEEVRVTAVEPVPGGGTRVVADVEVDGSNPILAGHYPGLPIFPGVCLIECVHRTVLAAARASAVPPTLERVVTARFLDTVFPGEQIAIRTLVVPTAGRWMVSATVDGRRGVAARIDLRYLPDGRTR